MIPKPLSALALACVALLSSAGPAAASPKPATLSGLDVRISTDGMRVKLSYTVQCPAGKNYYLTGLAVRQGSAAAWDDSLPLPYMDKIACGTNQTWTGGNMGPEDEPFYKGRGSVIIAVAVCEVSDPTLCQENIFLERKVRFSF